MWPAPYVDKTLTVDHVNGSDTFSQLGNTVISMPPEPFPIKWG